MKGKGKHRVTLTFVHQIKDPVFVAGSFNDWDTAATPMKRSRNDRWQARLSLPPGKYEFRYFAGGQWYTDHAADGVVPNGFGEFNSVLQVPSKAAGSKRKTR
jgi:hypothetical protein